MHDKYKEDIFSTHKKLYVLLLSSLRILTKTSDNHVKKVGLLRFIHLGVEEFAF